VVRTDGAVVYVLAAEEKWVKAKAMLNELLTKLDEGNGNLNRTRLEQIQGFLIYVMSTYPGMVPYLIGIHITIDGWRRSRDARGWRLSSRILRDRREQETSKGVTPLPDEEVPVEVMVVPRLRNDLVALLRLMKGSKPRIRKYRCNASAHVTYGFGDASGQGFEVLHFN
jgi:hypothetical protein